jgi:hypothetical protein
MPSFLAVYRALVEEKAIVFEVWEKEKEKEMILFFCSLAIGGEVQSQREGRWWHLLLVAVLRGIVLYLYEERRKRVEEELLSSISIILFLSFSYAYAYVWADRVGGIAIVDIMMHCHWWGYWWMDDLSVNASRGRRRRRRKWKEEIEEELIAFDEMIAGS